MSVFEIVKMEDRVNRMLTYLAAMQKRLTDFRPGSVTRTKLEAIALEFEQQDYQIYRAIKKAIPLSVYRTFGFPLLPANRASGVVTFTATEAPAEPIVIPKGTIVSTIGTDTTPEKSYETTEEVTLLAATTTIQANIVSTKAGAIGDTGAGTITVLKVSIAGIGSGSNTLAIQNGKDLEAEDDRSIRFRGYIRSLQRGTDDAIAYGAMTAALVDGTGVVTEKVTSARVVGGTIGSVVCVIHNGVGGTSAELIAKTQQIINGYIDQTTGERIPGYKVAGIPCSVVAAIEKPVDITMIAYISAGYNGETVAAQAESAATGVVLASGVNGNIYRSALIAAAKSVPGVYDVVLTVPISNVGTTEYQVATVGTVTVIPG